MEDGNGSQVGSTGREGFVASPLVEGIFRTVIKMKT